MMADYCPMCDNETTPLGRLGTIVHYRCRDCGWGWGNDEAGVLSGTLEDPWDLEDSDFL